MKMIVGKKYNMINEPERLVYLGKQGRWNQFAKIESPSVLWLEVQDGGLCMLEKTEVLENSFSAVRASVLARLGDKLLSITEMVEQFNIKKSRMRNIIKFMFESKHLDRVGTKGKRGKSLNKYFKGKST